MKPLLKTNLRLGWITLGLLSVVFLLIAFWSWRSTPAFWFDEGIYYQIAKNWAEKDIAGIMLSPDLYSDLSLISVGYSVFYPAVWMFKIFGASVETIRLTAILFMTGFVSVFYCLGKELFGSKKALYSLALLITFSPLYGNGKSFLGEVPGLFYFFSALYFSVRLEKTNHSLFAFLSGIFFGLAISAKPVYLLILPAVGLAMLCRANYFFSKSGARILIWALLGLVGPLAFWLTSQFGVGTQTSQVLGHYANPYYVTDFASLVFKNSVRFVTETTPIHFLGLLLIGLIYIVLKIRQKETVRLAEWAILFFSILMLGFYLRTAGWYRYFFPAHATLFVLLVPGLWAIMEALPGRIKSLGIGVWGVIGLIIALQLFPLSEEALSSKIDAPSVWRPILEDVRPAGPVLFYSVPQLAGFYPGEFYQYLKMSDHLALGQENLEKLSQGFFGTIFIEEAKTRAEAGVERVVLPECFSLEKSIQGIEMYQKTRSKC